MSEDSSKDEQHDVVLIHGRTADGEGLRALRSRANRLALAELRPLKEGKPLSTCEVVSLSPRDDNPLLFDVKVQHEISETSLPNRSRPARVSTQAYRQNWDVIFGKQDPSEDDLPN